MMSGRKRRWNAITAFCAVGQRHSRSARARGGTRHRSRRVQSGRASELGSARRRLASAAHGNSSPGSSLRRPGDVRMADDIASPDAVPLLDVGDEWDQRGDLLVRKRAVAKLVAGIDDPRLPTLAELTSVIPRQRDSPACQARLRFSPDQPIDRAVLVGRDNGTKPWIRARSTGRARPRRRACRCNEGRSSRRAASARQN